MSLKITPADRWFGRCIKERAGWKCEVCGKQYEEGSQGLHTSHFWSRRYQSVRHDPDNAAAMCYGCHQRMGGNPLEFCAWVATYLGEERTAALARRKNRTVKIKRYLTEIALHFHLEYDVMRAHKSRVVAPFPW